MHVAGMFGAIWGYLSANNEKRINRKKGRGKKEDYALDITSIEKHLDQFYEEQRQLLEARLLEMRDKLNERVNLKANQNNKETRFDNSKKEPFSTKKRESTRRRCPSRTAATPPWKRSTTPIPALWR